MCYASLFDIDFWRSQKSISKRLAYKPPQIPFIFLLLGRFRERTHFRAILQWFFGFIERLLEGVFIEQIIHHFLK